MNNEKMLKNVNELINNFSSELLLKFKNELEEDIRKEVSLKSGNPGKQDVILKRILKRYKKNYLTIGIWKYNNKFMFTDGYSAYITANNFGYKDMKITDHTKDIGKMITTPGDYINTIKIDTNDLRAFCKTEKAAYKPKGQKKVKPYILSSGNFKIGLNPHYLIDLLDFYKTDTIYCRKDNYNPVVTSLDFSNDFGFLLPIRIDD